MVTKTGFMQHAAISLAWKSPMANEEIAGTAAYRAAAPDGVRLQGITMPTAEFQRGGIALVPVSRTAVFDRLPANAVPGPAPRGRPV
jgi:hypothetical protein